MFVKQTYGAENLSLSHIIAQKDIEFSNYMIEAVNKNLKYNFFYHKDIADFGELCKPLPQAVDEFNNRPNNVLAGLTPAEVLDGVIIDKNKLSENLQLAKETRLKQNRKTACCAGSF